MASAPENRSEESFAPPVAPELHVDKMTLVRPPERGDRYWVRSVLIAMDDDTKYPARIYVPDHVTSDIPVTGTTPWWTALPARSAGFNNRIGHELAAQGIATLLVGPEHLGPKDLLHRLGRVTLAHDVDAHLAILRFCDETEQMPTKPGTEMVIGYSRGSMLGAGIKQQGERQGRNVPFIDGTDPCCAHRIGVRDIDWRGLRGYAKREASALIHGLANYSLPELFNLAQGYDASLCFVIQQAALVGELLSGKAGKFVDWRQDSVGHVTLYDGSEFNHAPEWQEGFGQYPYVTVRVEPGMHLTGTAPQVLENTVRRVVLVKNMLEDNATPTELGEALANWQPPQTAKPRGLLACLPGLKAA